MPNESANPDEAVSHRPRGFARLSPEERRRLGSKGGRTAHARGTANTFTPEAASRAGKVPHQRGTAHHWTSEEARAAGRKGGVAARKSRRLSEGARSGEPQDDCARASDITPRWLSE